jgi:quercetin dioxygenase-like cupin family protein
LTARQAERIIGRHFRAHRRSVMPLRSFLLTLLPALAGATLLTAGEAGREPAMRSNARDADLKWGPCPELMPAGCQIAVLHGDPSKPNADVYLKVPAGADIPNHRHSSAERMVLVAGALEVTYEGQAPTKLSVGDYAYGPAGRPHRGRCTSSEPCVLFIAFEGPVDAIPVDR